MEPGEDTSAGKSGISYQLIIFLVLAVLLVIFTLQNQDKVSVKLFFWTIQGIPVALLIILCLLIGYLIPLFSFIPRIWRLKRELRQSHAEIEELESRVEADEDLLEEKRRDPEGILLEDDQDESPDKPAGKGFFSGKFFRE